jgi:hypothetical protein
VRSEGKAQIEQLQKWFADHRATVTAHDPADESQYEIQTLYWAKPGTGHLAVRYVIMGPVLMVWGDLESAVYRWSSVISWEFLAGCDLQYFESKCEASPKGRDYEDYDSDLALADFNEDIKRRAEEGYAEPDQQLVDDARQALRYGLKSGTNGCVRTGRSYSVLTGMSGFLASENASPTTAPHTSLGSRWPSLS